MNRTRVEDFYVKTIVDEKSVDDYLTPKSLGAIDKAKCKYENTMAEFNIKRKVDILGRE